MPSIFTFSNQKGGVGKTTSVINISYLIANKGLKVLVVDIDPQGNATSGFGIDKSAISNSSYDLFVNDVKFISTLLTNVYKNIDVVPSLPDLAGAEVELVSQVGREFQLRQKLSGAIDRYDAVFIDCPPSLGLLTLNALTTAQHLMIPLQCEYYALEGLGQLIHTFQIVKNRLNPALEIGGVILTMADTRTKLTTQVVEDVRKHFGEKVFRTVIPRSVRLSEAPSYGKPISVYAKDSKGAKSYADLSEEFFERFWGGGGKGAPPDVREETKGLEREPISKEKTVAI